MIQKIGVIYQDATSLGFLKGIKTRLGCDAELVLPRPPIGKPQLLPARKARLAWEQFHKDGVDLVVRFTDADRARWQEVQRRELRAFPNDARSFLICGVAVNNPEQWLALDPIYCRQMLHISEENWSSAPDLTGIVKRAVARAAEATGEDKSEFVAGLVRNAPLEVFRLWLQDPSLSAFYKDCRAAALQSNCPVPNEMDAVA